MKEPGGVGGCFFDSVRTGTLSCLNCGLLLLRVMGPRASDKRVVLCHQLCNVSRWEPMTSK